MAHRLRRILLIDDTHSHQQGCGSDFYRSLNDELKEIIDFSESLSDKIELLDAFEAKTLFNEKDYEIVLLHASYNSPMLNSSQLSSLKFKIIGLITFSGGANSSLEHNITSREQLYRSLKRVLNAYVSIGVFPKRALYDNNINRFYPLMDKMQEILEQEGKEGLLNSEAFSLYINILSLDLESVKRNYRENKSEDELNEKINEWRINFTI